MFALDKPNPMEGLNIELHCCDKEVFLLKVRNTDEYFVSLTNTVNFGDITEAYIFTDKESLILQHSKLPKQFSRGNIWEALRITLENL